MPRPPIWATPTPSVSRPHHVSVLLRPHLVSRVGASGEGEEHRGSVCHESTQEGTHPSAGRCEGERESEGGERGEREEGEYERGGGRESGERRVREGRESTKEEEEREEGEREGEGQRGEERKFV